MASNVAQPRSDDSLDYLFNLKGQPLDIPALSNNSDPPTSVGDLNQTKVLHIHSFEDHELSEFIPSDLIC